MDRWGGQAAPVTLVRRSLVAGRRWLRVSLPSGLVVIGSSSRQLDIGIVVLARDFDGARTDAFVRAFAGLFADGASDG